MVKVIDGENSTLGRLASFVAKEALSGNELVVINSEKVLMSGRTEDNVMDHKAKRALNTIKPRKGPFFSKDPEKMVKRTIRGMLPDFRKGRGKVAWKKIKCYVGMPEEFKNEKIIKLKLKIPNKYATMAEISRKL